MASLRQQLAQSDDVKVCICSGEWARDVMKLLRTENWCGEMCRSGIDVDACVLAGGKDRVSRGSEHRWTGNVDRYSPMLLVRKGAVGGGV